LTNGTTTAGVRGPGGDDLPASRDVAVAAARAASGKQAEDIVVLDVSEVIVITDYFVLCTATSSRQVKTVIEAVEEEIRALGVRPVRREGEADAGWWLLDYVDVVVHVFGVEEREYYDLERLWRDAPVVDWEDASLASGA
jgi:ribosome-associated protein